MFNRFYSFGCSFTHHIWVTWANIIALDLKIPFENWGKSGAGNQTIQSKVVECDFVNRFTKDDLIIIVWTSWQREDRFLNGYWNCFGSIFNNPLYDTAYIEKYWSEENDYIKNITAMHTTRLAYKEFIKFEAAAYLPGLTNSETNLEQNQSYSFEQISKIYYSNYLRPEIFPFDFKRTSSHNGNCRDNHPDILDHLSFVKKSIYPKLGLTIKKETEDFCHDYFNQASSALRFEDNYPTLTDKILRINERFGINLKDSYGIG